MKIPLAMIKYIHRIMLLTGRGPQMLCAKNAATKGNNSHGVTSLKLLHPI